MVQFYLCFNLSSSGFILIITWLKTKPKWYVFIKKNYNNFPLKKNNNKTEVVVLKKKKPKWYVSFIKK